MADTYRALAVLLSYPTNETAALMPAVMSALEGERLVSTSVLRKLSPLLEELSAADLYDAQSRYVDLFDRTRSLSLQLYEHVHGESRDRGQAMVELLKLYSSRGLELTAKELPDHLPVFLEFLSQQPADEAAAMLGEAAHVLQALWERLEAVRVRPCVRRAACARRCRTQRRGAERCCKSPMTTPTISASIRLGPRSR